MTPNDESRRSFVKRAAYVAPAILTMAAAPAYAKNGSEKHDKERDKGKVKVKDEKHAQTTTTLVEPSKPFVT